MRTRRLELMRPEEIVAELALPVSSYTIHREQLVWGVVEESSS